MCRFVGGPNWTTVWLVGAVIVGPLGPVVLCVPVRICHNICI